MANESANPQSAIHIDEAGRIIVTDPRIREALARALARLAANPDSVTGNDRCTSFNNDCGPRED